MSSRGTGDFRNAFTNDGSDEMMGIRAPLALPYNIMQHLRRYEGYEMAHFSMHDLRRTARSRFSTITSFHVAEVMLGHAVGSQVARVYDRYDYLAEQAEAYEAWCEKLFRLVDDKPENPIPEQDNVVTFTAKKRA